MRIAARELGRERDPVEHGERAPLPILRRADAGDVERLTHAFQDRHARIERGVGILEDDLKPAAMAPQLIGIEHKRILAVVQHAPARRPHQAHDAARERRLARAGLADDAKRLALRNPESHAVHGADKLMALARRKRDLELVDGQDIGHDPAPARTSASARRQRTWRSPRATSICGSRQAASTWLQRGPNRQPVGISRGEGTRPGIDGSFDLR